MAALLFLDEIGDMSISAQAKVLRALQEGRITRVGGDKEIEVDVRVIAATNKDLLKEVDEKNFRLDLYHRLSVILIHVPSLNERRSDIPLLVNKFLVDIAEEYNQPVKEISDRAMQVLDSPRLDRQYPGTEQRSGTAGHFIWLHHHARRHYQLRVFEVKKASYKFYKP